MVGSFAAKAVILNMLHIAQPVGLEGSKLHILVRQAN